MIKRSAIKRKHWPNPKRKFVTSKTYAMDLKWVIPNYQHIGWDLNIAKRRLSPQNIASNGFVSPP